MFDDPLLERGIRWSNAKSRHSSPVPIPRLEAPTIANRRKGFRDDHKLGGRRDDWSGLVRLDSFDLPNPFDGAILVVLFRRLNAPPLHDFAEVRVVDCRAAKSNKVEELFVYRKTSKAFAFQMAHALVVLVAPSDVESRVSLIKPS